jgi:probable HAF family extracellular repeat protein
MKLRTLTCLAANALYAALALFASAQSQNDHPRNTQYRVFDLGVPLGGSVSADNGVNDLGWSVGETNLTGDTTAHAVLWLLGWPIDLGSLGGPNSAVLWPGINDLGEVVGVSDTAMMDPYGETWSCGAFLPASHNGHTCVGFKWEFGHMTALPTLGGNNGFATAVNDHGQIVGWAENTVHDPTCVAPQVLQFEAVIWGPGNNQMQQLAPYGSDPDSAATGINDRGQVVGISGICQNAVGNQSATHALLWQNGVPISLGNLGGTAWNTPMAINNQGIVVGFSDLMGDQGGSNPNFHAFLWARSGPMQDLGTLPGDAISEALGVNAQNQIVGVSFAAGFANPRAFIYESGGMIDLNTLAPNSPVYLQVGGDINDEGVIVGQGCLPTQCASGTSLVSFIAIPTGDGKYQVNVTDTASEHSLQKSTKTMSSPAQLLSRVAFAKLEPRTAPQQ